jgi:uncharacterized protein (DUF924 family)
MELADRGTYREEIVMSSPEEVLSYWFPEEDLFEADPQTFGRQMKWWFQGGPEVDSEISERFGEVLEQARRGELDHWAETPRGRLALIVVLDQFSRNVYRARPSPTHRTRKPSSWRLKASTRGWTES